MYKPAAILSYLASLYPEHATILFAKDVVPCLVKQELDIREAVTRTIISQMLSRMAAKSIFLKVYSISCEKNINVWELSHGDYRKCGLSMAKVKSINSFVEYYSENPVAKKWSLLKYSDLVNEVDKVWGISKWTASMLSIFYFANENVFPERDKTIENALNALFKTTSKHLDASLCARYKSYLALYLWQAIDKKYI